MDLKVHHIYQNIVPRLLLQEQCNSRMKTSGKLISAAYRLNFVRRKFWMLHHDNDLECQSLPVCIVLYSFPLS